MLIKIDCGDYSHRKLKKKFENQCTERFVFIDEYPDKSSVWVYFNGSVDISLIKTYHTSIISVDVIVERNIRNTFSNIIRMKNNDVQNNFEELKKWFHIDYIIRVDTYTTYATKCDTMYDPTCNPTACDDEFEWAIYYVEGLGCVLHGDDMMMHLKKHVDDKNIDNYLIWRIFNY